MSESTGKKKSSLPMVIILVVSIVPIVGAYIAYYTGLGVSADTVNEGTLLKSDPPANIIDLLNLAEGEKPDYERNYAWRLIVPIPEYCNQACQDNLYTTRQVHIRLGEKAERVERYAALIGGQASEDYYQNIREEHPRLKAFSISRDQWLQWLQASNVPQSMEQEHYYLLIDQIGFAMMFYTSAHEGSQLLKDIKRILRYSLDK